MFEIYGRQYTVEDIKKWATGDFSSLPEQAAPTALMLLSKKLLTSEYLHGKMVISDGEFTTVTDAHEGKTICTH